MATFYVPIENPAQPIDALCRWFFLVVDAPDPCEALIAVKPILKAMPVRTTTWWPQRECPEVSYMQELRAGRDRVSRSPRRAA